MYCSVFLKAVTLAVKGEHAGKRLVMEIWQSLWALSLVRFSSVSPLSPCSGKGRRMDAVDGFSSALQAGEGIAVLPC